MRKIAETDIGLRKLQKSNWQLILLLLLFSLFQSTAFSQTVLEQKVTLKAEEKTLEQIIKQISTITKVEFIYVSNVLDNEVKLSVDYKNKPLSEILTDILTKNEIEFEEEYSRIILRKFERNHPPQLILEQFRPPKKKQ